MTLPELLIAITVMGLIITVLSTAVIVTIKQEANTSGRLDVARAEQSIGLWMPADLASAQTVSTDPWASPCGATTCGGTDLSTGSNVVMLTWEIAGVTTNVSYHFRPSVGRNHLRTAADRVRRWGVRDAAAADRSARLAGRPRVHPWPRDRRHRVPGPRQPLDV